MFFLFLFKRKNKMLAQLNFQKSILLCFLFSYITFCHLLWNGCYNIYATSEDEMYAILYSKKKESNEVKLELQNDINVEEIKNLYVKTTPCPVLPRPLKSIFHMNWFRRSSELIPISIQLYSMFSKCTNLLGFLLLCSAVFTVIEWGYLIYIGFTLLWNGVLRPIFKILHIVITFYLILKFIVVFLPYTKTYISPDIYNCLSKVFYSSYHFITKLSKEFTNVMNRLLQDASIFSREL